MNFVTLAERKLNCMSYTYTLTDISCFISLNMVGRFFFVSQKFTFARSVDLISYSYSKTEQNNNLKKKN